MKMRFQRLLLGTAIACLVVGASGAAMARNDCPGGAIVGGVVDEIVINVFESCSIVGVLVTDRIRITGADDINIVNSSIRGDARVRETRAVTVVGNLVSGGNLVARDNLDVSVANNVVQGGSILVTDDREEQTVLVQGNTVDRGNLRVNGNERAEVTDNSVTDGDIVCKDNDRIDAKDNSARGGKVDCSRFFD
jgi:hypothetical protein